MIPAAFKEITNFFVNPEIVGAGLTARTRTASGAADQSVFTAAASLVVADTFSHHFPKCFTGNVIGCEKYNYAIINHVLRVFMP